MNNLKMTVLVLIVISFFGVSEAKAAVEQGKLGATSIGKTNVTLSIPAHGRIKKFKPKYQSKSRFNDEAFCLISNDSAGHIIKVAQNGHPFMIINGGKSKVVKGSKKIFVKADHKNCISAKSKNAFSFKSAQTDGIVRAVIEPQ